MAMTHPAIATVRMESLGAGVRRVARAVRPGLADVEIAVVVGVADIVNRVAAQDGRHRRIERVGHHDAGQRLVAGVRDRDRVIDDVALRVQTGPRRGATKNASPGALLSTYRCRPVSLRHLRRWRSGHWLRY